jgi:hypothetical protein
MLYLKDTKNSKNLLDMINAFSNIAGYKTNIQEPVALLYTNKEQGEKEIRKTNPFMITSKIVRNKLN